MRLLSSIVGRQIHRTFASHGFITLCRFFFRPAGRKKNLQKKKSTIMRLLYERPAADECIPYYFTYINLVPVGDIIHTLQSQHADIHMLLKNTSDARACAHPAPSEWSIKEV